MISHRAGGPPATVHTGDVPSTLPTGDPVPPDGSLPDQAYVAMAERTLSVYLHVPFCATRCGYCDFNTYTAGELGAAASAESWLDAALAEIDLAAKVLAANGDSRQVATVFVGGGTPSLVGADPLARLLDAVRDRFGLRADAEVTTEANPESTDPALLAGLRAAGFTRLSLGLQSTSIRVLRVLDRTHTPGRALQVVGWARSAGFDHVNLDLIYGAPGESDAEFIDSLLAAVASGADHVSAYSLIVEPGTRLAVRVRRGEVPPVDDDELADRYEAADDLFAAAGLHWYEVSNWARTPADACRHNVGYWRGDDWWGAGPGAHSHVGGVRWWNVRHPRAYAERLAAGLSPAAGREVLADFARHEERVLLGVRLVEGLPLNDLDDAGRRAVAALVADELIDGPAAVDRAAVDRAAVGRVVLTRRGRLLADAVVRALLA